MINAPNQKGFDCDVEVKRFDFADGSVNVDLPNYIQSVFKNLTPANNPNAPCGRHAFSIYPNPFADELTIEAATRCAESYRISLYDALGKKIIRADLFGEINNLELPGISRGLYLLMIQTTNGHTVFKLVKG